MTDPVPNNFDQYETYARHCLSLTAHVRDRSSRLLLREMAAEWLNLTAHLSGDGALPSPAGPIDGARLGT